MTPLYFAIRALATYARLRQEGFGDRIKDAYEEVKSHLTPKLPPPPNGVEWTDDDFAAIDAEHAMHMANIIERHSS